MTAMLPAHLTETLNNLGDAARELADEVHEDRMRRDEDTQVARAAQRRQNRITVTLLVIVALLVITLLTIGVQNRRRSDQNAQILRQTAVTSAQIADCTTVGGKCYEQGGQRTAEAARLIIRAQIYYESCAEVNTTDDAVEQCVMRRLLASSTPATPAPTAQPSAPAPSATAD